MTNKKYGLMLNGKLLKYSVSPNPENSDGVAESYELEVYGDNDWLVNDEITAEYARNYSTEWYNATYETPINQYVSEKDKITVVEVEITIEIKPIEVKIPTMEEYLRARYPEPESKNHLDYCLDCYKKGTLLQYSLYELKHNLKIINQRLAQRKA